eukprot:TRINITY_DN1737_c0_g1_i1.p2 TRINITY_DN1737_c0_g1~~TRINITY_DN1737_c0_g1_i1.p2  ORF type:complete len:157 (-),score=29.15 TRINITY_DN1737_c0_g1_i1:27-497(-)
MLGFYPTDTSNLEFIAWMPLIGGSLIGSSIAFGMYSNGQIIGNSGIIKGLITPTSENKNLRFTFLSALIGTEIVMQYILPLPAVAPNHIGMVILGGLLVGIGTSLGSGCTSGHGICGVSRFSIRSIVATAVFFLVAIVVTSFLTKSLMPNENEETE